VAADAPANTRPSRPVRVYAAALLAFAAAAAASGYATFTFNALRVVFADDLHARSFDAGVWNHPDWQESETFGSGYHSIRQRMVDDLLATHLRPGLSRDAVTQLIGPAEENSVVGPSAPNTWTYRLGMERGFSPESEWLLLEFDDRGTLSRAFLVTH